MAQLEKFYIEEFLYRGRRSDDDRPSGWHVIVGLEGVDPLGRPFPPMGIMSSAQAVEAGWDVPEIIAKINLELAADLEEQRAKLATLQQALEKSQSELAVEQERVRALSASAEEKIVAD
jgi:hypothetical protein